MFSTACMEVEDESQIGEVRRTVAEICRRRGADETVAGQAAIVASELATNLVRHGGGGEILLNEGTAGDFGLELMAVDAGSGIANLGEALSDGYSTNGTAGTGLGAVRRLAAKFEIYSQPGKGTAVWTYFGEARALAPRFSLGGVCAALAGEPVCGDAWGALSESGRLRVMVADGLGHGLYANEAAREAMAVFRERATSSPAAVIEFTHLALGKTRGAAGAIVEIDRAKGAIRASAIGNISMRVCTHEASRSLVSDNGTLGANARRAQENQLPWTDETILVMHSDGLGTQWDLNKYPGLAARHPSLIAAVLYRDFQRQRDDTTVVVVKEAA